MSKYNPTKKRSGLEQVTEYCYGPAHGLFGREDIQPIGRRWVRKGTVLPVRNLRQERYLGSKRMADEMLNQLGIKQ